MSHAGPTAPADLRPNPPGATGIVEEVLDPELLALDAPPQGQRLAALTVMAAAVVAVLSVLSVALLFCFALTVSWLMSIFMSD